MGTGFTCVSLRLYSLWLGKRCDAISYFIFQVRLSSVISRLGSLAPISRSRDLNILFFSSANDTDSRHTTFHAYPDPFAALTCLHRVALRSAVGTSSTNAHPASRKARRSASPSTGTGGQGTRTHPNPVHTSSGLGVLKTPRCWVSSCHSLRNIQFGQQIAASPILFLNRHRSDEKRCIFYVK